MKGEEGARPLAAWVAVGALGALHYVFRPLLVEWWGAPDLAAAAVLVAVLHLRAGRAAAAGFVLGLLDEAMALETVGPLAAVYAVAGYVGARAWELFFTDAWLFLPLYMLSGAWTLIVVKTLVTSSDLTWGFALLEAPVAAALTAAAAAVAGRPLAPARAG